LFATTLPRLLDMGIEPFLIASTVNTVIGQRLVRRLCQTCRIPYVPVGVELTNIKRDFQLDAALKRFNEIKGMPEAPATPAATAEVEAVPKVEEEAILPTEHKKGRVINPEHEIIGNAKSILDKIAADPNILNRSAAEANQPKAVAQTAPAAKEAKAPMVEPAPDPKDLKSGQFILYKQGPGCEACGGAGFQGRMGIYEVLEIDTTLSKLIVSRATSEDIHLLPFYFGAAAPAELPEDAKAFMKANEPMTDKIFALIDELGEQIIMSKFVYYNNDGSNIGNPNNAQQYYNYLRGIWKDGSPLVYGGNGYQTSGADSCDFMFPGCRHRCIQSRRQHHMTGQYL
jgi:hypothetical protein